MLIGGWELQMCGFFFHFAFFFPFLHLLAGCGIYLVSVSTELIVFDWT